MGQPVYWPMASWEMTANTSGCSSRSGMTKGRPGPGLTSKGMGGGVRSGASPRSGPGSRVGRGYGGGSGGCGPRTGRRGRWCRSSSRGVGRCAGCGRLAPGGADRRTPRTCGRVVARSGVGRNARSRRPRAAHHRPGRRHLPGGPRRRPPPSSPRYPVAPPGGSAVGRVARWAGRVVWSSGSPGVAVAVDQQGASVG